MGIYPQSVLGDSSGGRSGQESGDSVSSREALARALLLEPIAGHWGFGLRSLSWRVQTSDSQVEEDDRLNDRVVAVAHLPIVE